MRSCTRCRMWGMETDPDLRDSYPMSANMHALEWVDNRTLLACQSLVATVFMVVCFGLRRLHFDVRGINAVCYGFLSMTAAAILLAARGSLPAAMSIVMANLLVFIAYILMYQGILRFLEVKGYAGLLAVVVFLTMLPVVYFWAIHDNIGYRIAAMSFTVGIARALMAVALLRHAAGRLQLLLFAGALAIFALTSFLQTVLTLLDGAPKNFMQNDLLQTSIMIVGILFICVQGLFFLTMFAGDIAQTIAAQAEIDFLTATLNRRGIEGALATELIRMRRSEHMAAVLLIDVDHFKQINDTLGHAAGDAALRNVAKHILSCCRGYDRLGRFGGDEFLLLLPETTGEEALAIAERIRTSFGAIHPSELTVSIGAAPCGKDEAMQEVLAHADEAVYSAKRDGRNRALLYG